MITADKIRNIFIIGAGLMGSGLALTFASRGYNVYILDLNSEVLSKGLVNIRNNLGILKEGGITFEDNAETILDRIHTTLSIKGTASKADFVIEAVAENLELKQSIFHDLDSLCPADVILASNTSVISIAEIAAKTIHRDRIIGTHFWNPPYLIPLVEIVKSDQSSNSAVDIAFELMQKSGKHPVRVMKDVPGFIGNRLQHALWREAISIVQNGIADAASVDDVVKKGFGLRLPVLGPMENADMVGLDLALSIHNYILKHIEASPYPSPLLKEKVNSGHLGFKSGSGFYQWTESEIKESREKLLQHLMAATEKTGLSTGNVPTNKYGTEP